MMGSDIRFAVRTLARQRAFTLTAVATLMLGIGASTATFTLVNAVLIKPLPYARADRLVTIWPGSTVSPSGMAEATETRGVFDGVGAYSAWGMTVTGGQQAESLNGARVSPGMLTVLGVPPMTGRLFHADEDQAGRDAVVLLSAAYAVRRFGSADTAVGQRLIVNGVNSEVVGVMPPAFAFPDARSNMWTPITVDPARSDYKATFASLIGRLAPSVTADQAQSRMLIYAQDLRTASPKQYGPKFIQRAVVVPLQARLVREIRTPLLLLFGSVGILLAIACANVAILMLTRASARQGEMAVRAAMGAERLRIVRQLLVESAVLSILGGAGGVLLAIWLVSLAAPFIPATLPHTAAPGIDGSVLLFVAAGVIGSTLLFGLVPAWQISRPDMRQVLSASRGAGVASHGLRLRMLLVWAEVALATVLVVSAALLGRSFLAATRVPIGFEPTHVLTVRASLPDERYKEPEQITAVVDAATERIGAIPGVERVGAIQLLPLTPDNWNPGVLVDGVAANDQYAADVNWRLVTPAYFDAMSIPLRRGRRLASTDSSGAPAVALVNDTFARLVFRGEDPLGRRIRTAFEGKGEWAEVVGVVGDLHQHTIEDPSLPEMYRPFAQHPIGSMRFMVQVTGDPALAAPAVRAAFAVVDPNIALADVEPMRAVVDRLLGNRRGPLMVAALFAVTAFVLGLVGVTGVLSFDIAQRRREIGIRLALGATRGGIQRMVFRRGLILALSGVAAGVVGSLLCAGVMSSMLFGVSAKDPVTVVAVVCAFVTAMLVGIGVPAKRAANVDPVETMRE